MHINDNDDDSICGDNEKEICTRDVCRRRRLREGKRRTKKSRMRKIIDVSYRKGKMISKRDRELCCEKG